MCLSHHFSPDNQRQRKPPRLSPIIRESPVRKQDDALRCAPDPDSGRCPLCSSPGPPPCPTAGIRLTPKVQTGSSAAPPSYLRPGLRCKGGAGKMGLGYPSLKVSRVDRAASLPHRPYLRQPPVGLPSNYSFRGAQRFWVQRSFTWVFPLRSFALFTPLLVCPQFVTGLVQRSSCFQRWGPGGRTCSQVRVWPAPHTGQTHIVVLLILRAKVKHNGY